MAARRTTLTGIDVLIGQTIGGHYTLQRFLGRGTKALVFLATHRTMHRTVVVQLLNVPWADEPAAIAQFEDEAKALRGLDHPNIAAVHDFGRDPGRVWVAVEYVEGELLADYIKRMGRLGVEAFVPIAAQILKGLGGAHARGLVHRDLKASNVVLVEEQGRANYVKLLDLGIAALLEGPPDGDGDPPIVGEPGYVAPEVIMNKPADARSDVYSIGALFYQLLSGKLPFEGESAKDVLHKHVNDKPIPLVRVLPADHDVPGGLVELVHDCLAKNPDNRPLDANEIVERMIDSVPAAMFRLPVAAPGPRSATVDLAKARDAAVTEQRAQQQRAASLAAAVESSGVRPIPAVEPSVAVPAATATHTETRSGGAGWIFGLLALLVAGAAVYFVLESQKPPTEPAPPVVAQDPTQPPHAATAEAGLAKAQEFETAGRLQEALAAYEVVLVTDPSNARARERIAALQATLAQAADAKVEAPPPDTKVEAPPDTKADAPVEAPPPDTKVETPPPDTKVETPPPDTKVDATPPPPVKFTVAVEGSPRAEVFVDDAPRGKTPLTLELPPGPHKFELRSRNYEPHIATVEVAQDGQKQLKVRLVRKAGTGGINRAEENAASEQLDPEEGVGTKVEVPIRK